MNSKKKKKIEKKKAGGGEEERLGLGFGFNGVVIAAECTATF